MHKLITLVVLVISVSCTSAQSGKYILVNSKQDTATIDYRQAKDTAIFSIIVNYKNEDIQKATLKYHFKILSKGDLNVNPKYFFIDSSYNKPSYFEARKPTYFDLKYPYKNSKTKAKDRKQDYQKLIELENAFFDFGKTKFDCIIGHKFRKTYHHGSDVGLTYNPKFGLISLEIGQGDAVHIQDSNFKLISVDHLSVKEYLQKFCNR